MGLENRGPLYEDHDEESGRPSRGEAASGLGSSLLRDPIMPSALPRPPSHALSSISVYSWGRGRLRRHGVEWSGVTRHASESEIPIIREGHQKKKVIRIDSEDSREDFSGAGPGV
ncbi:hypothetical protein HYALB_00003706 [Hymenoscyphus albidus]|uniref:Uncharacterized protein n=1 Tax=Hymenoscyphus albidus TaxID=595503 RepID=A0A9N9LH41_9HELO|nr:hypothetical protein HYALB_00003706 [Hymenoscyphus albidus]